MPQNIKYGFSALMSMLNRSKIISFYKTEYFMTQTIHEM